MMRPCPEHVIRRSEHSVEEVLSAISSGQKINSYGGRIGMYRLRSRMYLMHGIDCAYCGLKGSFFAVERHKRAKGKWGRWRLHLYAELPDGGARLMTIDHVIPRAASGRNHINNLLPACSRCNFKKGEMTVNEWLHHRDHRQAFYYEHVINWKKLYNWKHMKRIFMFVLRNKKLPTLPRKKRAVHLETPVLQNENARWLLYNSGTF